MNTPSISFIGGGNMANAILGGLRAQGYPAANLHVVETDADKRKQLHEAFGVSSAAELASASQSDVIVLAVKPQQLRDIAIFLGSLLHQQLVISIAAGIRCNDLSRWLGGYAAIVRVMPNTPAQVGAGISALYAMPAVSSTQRELAAQLMNAVGSSLWLEQEAQMDAVTAISGSGPAYVFYLIEALEQAALTLGLTAEQARQLSVHTFAGAGQLALHSPDSPGRLREQVTSKGGTTEQGLLRLQQHAVNTALLDAARAAAARSQELGDLLGKD